MSERRWLALAATLLLGCAPTIVALRSHRGHRALDEHALASLSARAELGTLDKAGVLTILGPPVVIVGQTRGEIFVYRHVARDTSEYNLNPGYLVQVIPPFPLLVDSNVSGRDDLLMLFFDSRGRLADASLRQSVGDVGDSRAARQNDRVRGWVR